MTTDLVPLSNAEMVRGAQPGPLDQAITFWLHAKAGRSGSKKTAYQKADGSWAGTYPETITTFRAVLKAARLDLDSDARAVALAAQGWAAQRAPNSRSQGDVSPSTYNQRLATLSSFYRYAKKLGLLTGENPIDRVERRSVQAYASATPIDKTALRARLKAIERDGAAGQRDYALLAIYVNTGRRLSEVAALSWADVHQDGDRVTLDFRHAKGDKAMRDTLPAGISKALMTWLATAYGLSLIHISEPTRPY